MTYFFKDKFWFYTISFTLVIIIGFPILIILLLSFKTNTEINFTNFFNQFSFDTYRSIWNLEFRNNNNSPLACFTAKLFIFEKLNRSL